ncbi:MULTISPECIES: phosphopantetheine-binding protein [Streptomyces]|uniref:Phosphopantetheine attachment site n=2 Tax=Streptomyces TaxID=1883 RepID=A0A0W7X1I2_9ACTN|nr:MULTISPECIES: phosphopantetheine-binding protein [Streptomyces]KUF16717.1 phosphopantetheine attachment site [Streptomyces silvensis]MVO88699.1 acyl carrier protein [Streptomyces typhae]
MPVSVPGDQQEIQKLVVDWLCEYLEIPEVSLTDNFLDLGGHSLLAMNINARVQQQYGQELDVKTLFEQSIGEAVAELHTRLTAAKTAA